jgi:hypothetical protein
VGVLAGGGVVVEGGEVDVVALGGVIEVEHDFGGDGGGGFADVAIDWEGVAVFDCVALLGWVSNEIFFFFFFSVEGGKRGTYIVDPAGAGYAVAGV